MSPPESLSPEPQAARAVGGPLATVVRGGLRQWPIAAAVGLVLGAAAGAGYFFAATPKVTVSTTLLVDAANSGPFGDRAGGAQTRDDEYRKAQMAMLRSRNVIKEALKDQKSRDTQLLIEAQPDAVSWLETNLKMFQSDGGFIRLSLTGRDGAELATVLNALTAAYTRVVVDAEKDELLRKIDVYDKVLVSVDDQLRGQRETILRLEEQFGGDAKNLSLRQRSALEIFTAQSAELLRLDSEHRRAKGELVLLKLRAESAKTVPVPETVLAEAVDADKEVRAAAGKVDEARALLDLTGKTAAPAGTALTKLRQDVDAAEKALAAVRQQQRDVVAERVKDAIARQAATQVRECEAKLELLDRQRADLAPEVSRREREVNGFGSGSKSHELELKRMESAETNAINQRFRAEKARLEIEARTFRRRVNVFSPADADEARPAASRYAAAGGLSVAGLVVGFVLVGLVESRRRRLFEPSDVSRALEIRTVGTIPFAISPTGGAVFDLWDGRHGLLGAVVIESVNDIRAMLLCGELAGRAKVVAVTSASQGEGKTTFASLLAASVAQTGKRVLLIDGDIRNPRVHERFGVPAWPGFAEALCGEVTAATCVLPIPDTSLSVLPAGRTPRAVARGLTSDRINAVLATVRDRFDLVIIDTSPLLPVPDGVIVSKAADATLLVVRSGQSREPQLREACDRLAAVRANLVGSVLNGLALTKSRLRYPYAYRNTADGDPAAATGVENPEVHK